jgi:hypothetical protein
MLNLFFSSFFLTLNSDNKKVPLLSVKMWKATSYYGKIDTFESIYWWWYSLFIIIIATYKPGRGIFCKDLHQSSVNANIMIPADSLS